MLGPGAWIALLVFLVFSFLAEGWKTWRTRGGRG